MADERLDPDQLLENANEERRQEGRGKLKIYLGAAPGVGKTFEMLRDALVNRAKDLDVVVGIVESHGRADIEKMLKKFEILPMQTVQYRDNALLEFDLDAALQRRPWLILVDEMAHTNAPGLRHGKRWQDIKELLDRGIDVYTTLNVQHIESLKDNVAQIIQAPIKETVPNFMIERADTIELIDLPPEELLKRLEEGKIYFPEQAELAREHFFRRGNLVALRELALRMTAERVGIDVLWYRKGEKIKNIWPVKDKILVCAGPNTSTLKLIRAAKRIANSLQAEWLAVYIDRPGTHTETEDHNRAIENLRLAEILGAETHVLTGIDIVKEIMRFAREQNVTQIMICKHTPKRYWRWLQRSLSDEIVLHSGEIDVYIMTTDTPHAQKAKKKPRSLIPWDAVGIATCVVTLATLVNLLICPFVAASNLIMIYLLAVTLIALLGRGGPSVYASILSVFAYDFFFIPPFYSFFISDFQYVLTLVLMLVVVQIISYLTIKARRQAESAYLTQHKTTALYSFSRKLMSRRGVDKLLESGLPYLANAFNSDMMVLLPHKKRLTVQSCYPLEQQLSEKEASIAQWVYDMGQAAGLGTDTLTFSNSIYLPLSGTSGPIGVLRVKPHSSQLFSPEQRGLLESCMNQMALALEVDHLQEKTRKKELEKEADRARLTLVTAIFHDLSHPLRKVIAAINSLKELKGVRVRKIEKNINYEINKLNRLNNNLYHAILLESQQIELNKTLASLQEQIEFVVNLADTTLEKRPVNINIPEKIPLILMDCQLIREVLIHLIENAIKFSPADSPIHISVDLEYNQVVVSILDFGSGIMPEDIKKLFKKFYRRSENIGQDGLGLGLAICHKIITAHQGRIWAENVKNKGAVFHFSLPLPDAIP